MAARGTLERLSVHVRRELGDIHARAGGFAPNRLPPCFNVWYHISAPNPLGIFPSAAGCCDTSGSTNAQELRFQHKGERAPRPLRTLPRAAAHPASASAFLASTRKRWRSRFHLVNHLVRVLNPSPFIISWQGDGGQNVIS